MRTIEKISALSIIFRYNIQEVKEFCHAFSIFGVDCIESHYIKDRGFEIHNILKIFAQT